MRQLSLDLFLGSFERLDICLGVLKDSFTFFNGVFEFGFFLSGNLFA